MKLANTPQKLIILGLTLLAFLLRAYRLDFQSYWIDETWTVYFANLSPAGLWHLLTTVEPLPPFYHPSTIYWVRLVGDSEYAMRFYSLVFGVMAVPFTYRLGKDLGDDRLGVVFALLMTVAPYQIWHSQEARMYSILATSSAMSMWGFVNLWRRGGWRWWLVYVIGTEWAIATHYHGLVLIGIQGLFLLLTWRRHRRIYLAWGVTLILMLLLQVPWLIFGGNLLQSYLNWIEQPTLWNSFVRSAIAYSLDELVPHAQAIPLTLVFVTSYGLGFVYATRRRWGTWYGSEMVALLLAWTIAPNIAAWLYGEFRTTVYFERYLILVQPGYLLAVAMGILAIADGLPFVISWLKKQWSKHPPSSRPRSPTPLSIATAAVLLLALAGINSWALYRHYYDPVYAKPDWRAVAQTIENFGMPGDAILLTGDGGEHAFNFYYQGDLPVYYDFNISPHRQEKRKEGDEALQTLAGITANHRRLWYTPYGTYLDPMLEGWLAEHTHPAWHSWLGRKRLALYGTNPQLDRVETLNAAIATFYDQKMMLVSVALPNGPTPAGDVLPLTLTWQTNIPLPDNYQVSLRLTRGWEDYIFAQSDWPPLTATAPTSIWPVDQPITDRRSLWIPPDTPPGEYYTLQLVVYDPSTGQQIGEPIFIRHIKIGPAQTVVPLSALPIPNRTDQSFGPLKLVGYVLPDKIRPGEVMPFTLYFQTAPSHLPGATFFFTLSSGDVKDRVWLDPVDDLYLPKDSWREGQVRRFVSYLDTSPGLSGEQATFEINLIAQSSNRTLDKITLPPIKLESRPRQFEPPTIAHPTDIIFGDPLLLKLIGYDLPTTNLTPGDTLPVTLYWQAGAETDLDYTVFVQLLNSAGQVVTQVDLQPLAGAAPTTTWLSGEILTDPYTLALPPDLPPGDYRLITGLYNTPTGQRLPLSSGGDFVELPQVAVK